jgi:DNA-binding GntR family transcriptional regulator
VKDNGGKRDVYNDIQRKIITLEFAPGSDLDEATLVEMYGVSRTPIREALIRLAGEGLVVIKRNRGAYVSPLDVATLRAYFEAADFITRAVVRLASQRRSKTDLEAIEAAMLTFERAMARRDMAAMVEQNDRFHAAISAAAHNKYLEAASRRLLADHQRIAQLCYAHELETQDDQAKASTLEQHRVLFESVKRRDPATAERTALAHLKLCKEGLQQLLTGMDGLLDDLNIEDVAA